ncbi:MAG: cysteine synthase, partial [Lachnospiraceae bacterium]|nr:cysteine synthase [Lachnospiraceae bacterium]
MGRIYHSIEELVGNTPLLDLRNYTKENNLKARILGKIEYYNPNLSIKDRTALSMIEQAEKD